MAASHAAALTLLSVPFLLSTPASADSVSAELGDLRRWVAEQPRSFDNVVLFERAGDRIVRSSRFVGEGGMFGDFDGDDDVDLHDHNAFEICFSFSGPAVETPPACFVFDSEPDGDIDLADAAAFMEVFTGRVSGVLVEAGSLRPVMAPGLNEAYYSGEPGAPLNNALLGTAAHGGYGQDDLWYEWTLDAAPAGSGETILANASLPATAYTILPEVLPGGYTFRLTVTNLITFEFGEDSAILGVGACLADPDCDDGNLCTDDICGQDATCSNPPIACGQQLCDPASGACVDCLLDENCDDGLFCTGMETCLDGSCAAGADPCDDGLFCTGMETCDELTEVCSSPGAPCAVDEDCNEADDLCEWIIEPPFDFTLGVDSLAGTGGDDEFRAPLLFNPPTGTSVPSLQTGDSANGGDGSDTLNAQFNFAAPTTVSPTLTSIEVLNITDFGTAATTLNGSAVTGATDINLANSTNYNVFTVTGLANIVNLGITQQALGATLLFNTPATNGMTDSTTLSFSGMTSGRVTLTTGTTNGFETLNIASDGSANTVSDIVMNGTTLHTVNVTGDADLTLVASLDSGVTTVDCTGATGDVSLKQHNAGVFTYTGGTGDDTIILGATYGMTDTIDGAGGSDALGGTTTMLGGTTAAHTNVTNIERLRVTDVHTRALDVSHFGSITGVTLDVGSNGGTITNAASGLGVTIGTRAGTSAGAGALGVTIAGSGVADTMTCTLNDAEQAGAVTFTGAETVNLVSNLDADGSAANTGTAGQNTFAGTTILTDTASSERLVITGTEQMNLTGAVTMDVIDASGFTQPLIMGAACTKSGVTVTGSSGNDTLFASAGSDILAGGAGNDTLNALAGNDIVTGGAGVDTFRQSAAALLGVDRQTITDFDDTITTGDIFNFNSGIVTLTGTNNFAGAASMQTHSTAGNLTQLAATEVILVTSATVTDFTSAASLTGTNLLTAVGGTLTGAIVGANDFLVCVADASGNVGVYYVDSADNACVAAEISLVAVLQGSDVAVGSLIFNNFSNGA